MADPRRHPLQRAPQRARPAKRPLGPAPRPVGGDRARPPRPGDAYALATSLLSSLATLPLAYYSGWVVERRYDLTNQTRLAWLGESLKGEALGLALGLPLTQGVYAVIRRYPRGWWAILSALAIPFTIVLSTLAPVLILPLFNTFEPIRDPPSPSGSRRSPPRRG